MRKYNFILMAFALLLGMAQCKKEPATPNGDNDGGVRITLKVNDGNNGEKLNVYPATGAVIFTQGDKIYVGNNGKYVGTLTFDNGLFQGTINDDLCSPNDFLHFYFVGNKPTSPTELTAGTTSYTVDISDQSTGLPAISYAPSTVKYSPSTTAYTAKLLNKSALVKFVPSTATSQPITVSGLNNEVQIDFANHTLAPTGNTGGITLFSESDSEKWAILLEQASLSGLTVSGSGFEATIDSTTLPEGITNNMYYNAGVGISMTAIYQTYEANNSNWSTVLASFNSESTPNPMLIVKTDISGNCTITREDGTIDFSNHSLSGALFLQNNVLNQTVTVRNGSVERVDGKDGTGDLYNGTVIFDNMTVRGNVSTDAHHYIVQGGTYGVASSHVFEQPYANAPYPALTEIYDGKFMKLAIQYGSGTATTYRLYGGKYNNRPDDSWCAEGYSIRSNTDSDSGTYPWVVSVLPEGALRGEFTINASGDKVYFSKGNLKYSNGTWSFHEQQYDRCFTSNGDVTSYYTSTGTFDLFCWGTSGNNHGAVAYQPWSTSTEHSDYYAYGNSSYNLYAETGQADWGCNAIYNGGNTENSGWRTLSNGEWNYVINTRTTSSGIRYAKANVNNVNGVILLPDNWSTSYYTLSSTNSSGANYSTNQITAEQWSTLEQHGAVFLPAAGLCRETSTSINFAGSNGYYWSASIYSVTSACQLFFEDSRLMMGDYYRPAGCSVRLVRNVQ